MAWSIKAAHPGLKLDGQSRFGVRLSFHCKNHQRRDVDNMAKLVLDSCTGLVWVDDLQVVELFARVSRGDPKPRTDIVIYPIEGNLYRMRKCEHCGNEFRVFPCWDDRPEGPAKFCSQKCNSESKRLVRICKECKREFSVPQCIVKRHRAAFCSRTCSAIAYGKLRTAMRIKTRVCQFCGGAVTRKEYKRCRSCFISQKGEPPRSNY